MKGLRAIRDREKEEIYVKMEFLNVIIMYVINVSKMERSAQWAERWCLRR